MPNHTTIAKLRAAIRALRTEDEVAWIDILAAETIRAGGMDAADLLHVALDDFQEDVPRDPLEN